MAGRIGRPPTIAEEVRDLIRELSDGIRSSTEIAALAGCREKYVQAFALKENLPRRRVGPPDGERNPAYVGGRRIDRDGYVLVSVPRGYPLARLPRGKGYGQITEHRLVMEQKLGRSLRPDEVVHHKDDLTIHNDPSNLELYASNAEHLRATLTGRCPRWSGEGRSKLRTTWSQRKALPRVGIYQERRARGEIRLRQILLAWLRLDKDSPYLVGTHRHLERAGIDYSSRSRIQRALADLDRRWEQDR